MSIKLINTSPSVTENDILSTQKMLGFSIPEPLKKTYLSNNGGVLENERCIYQSESYELDVKYFLPIMHSRKDGVFTVERLYEILALEKKLVPKNMLPFAIDGGGFPFCINIEDETIHFFNLENEKDIKIENNLHDFVSKVMSEEDAWG